MAILLAEIIDAIEDTLDEASTLSRSQTYDELTESLSVADLPALQVWPFRSATVSVGGGSDRSTFGGKGGAEDTPLRQKEYTVYADYYAAVRHQIGQDMSNVVDGIDAIEAILEQQDTTSLFGLAGIRSFQWYWEFATFTIPNADRAFLGARFVITVTVF